MSLILEVCVDCLDAAIHAMKGGADRIEICDRLDKGGLSPGMELVMDIASHKKYLGLEVDLYAMIRPDDGGTFQYTSKEREEMIADLHRYGSCGVLSGVVFGMLEESTPGGEIHIDTQSVKTLAFEAQRLGLDVTFHRAFDKVTNKCNALDFLSRECGISRVLTSGDADVAIESINVLRDLVRYCNETLGGRICIMPGSGVSSENAEYIIRNTGATEIHGSFQGCYKSICAVREVMQHM